MWKLLHFWLGSCSKTEGKGWRSFDAFSSCSQIQRVLNMKRVFLFLSLSYAHKLKYTPTLFSWWASYIWLLGDFWEDIMEDSKKERMIQPEKFQKTHRGWQLFIDKSGQKGKERWIKYLNKTFKTRQSVFVFIIFKNLYSFFNV